ncbi:protein kinase domain-containing protein [Streptomyces sp. MspMP-M5]|uniref:serine/threonine-protein kinase n=1 Tax=Streptomyces sp. MspMP-M5 TaxID=1155718 RepID=UPI000369F584|nr:protein kinase [Streptomyces sp. SID8354]
MTGWPGGERAGEPAGARPRERPTAPDSGGLHGRRIAGYLLGEEIGRGGMAVVYKAEDLRLGRTVAVKLLTPELARNDTFRKRFAYESRVAASLDHPHIVPVFEAGEADGLLYIAMRYVAGRDLRALLDDEGRLPLATACRIAGQVASALDAAHARGLVHRDVKPGNVLVAEGTDTDRPEHVYLTDFGLMKKSLSLTGFTSVGQFIGTLDYVAPEQIAGRPVDGRCDVYGLACVTYEMLAGTPPFVRDDDRALLGAHLHQPPPAPSGTRPDLPPAVDAVFARALAKEPEERYETCRGFVAALRAAGRAGTAGVSPAEPARSRPDVPVGGADRGTVQGTAPPPPPSWALPVFPVPGTRGA